MAKGTAWFYVFKRDGKIQAVKGTGNMPQNYPELENVWCIATRATTKEEAIQQALKLNTDSELGEYGNT